MKVSSPWLEAIEINEKVNTYVYFKRTPSAQSAAVKVILALQMSTIKRFLSEACVINTLWFKDNMLPKSCILLNGCELDSQQF